MGFGASATEIVLFIGSLLVAVSVSGALGLTSLDIAAGIKEKGDIVKDKLNTDFEIVNDPDNIPISAGYYIFYIKNTGTSNFYFNPSTVSVIIDGQMISSSNLVFSSSSGVDLKRAEVGQILVNTTLSSGYHTIKVVLHNGIARELIFRT